VSSNVFAAILALFAFAATTAWALVLAAILVGRGIGVPKDGRRGLWFAIVLFLPIIGTFIYAIRAMPQLPRIDRVVWISAIVVTAIVLLIVSAIQEEMALTSCTSWTDGDITSVLCTRRAQSIAATVGVSILAAAVTVIVTRRQRFQRRR
jgi:hypothetical protein